MKKLSRMLMLVTILAAGIATASLPMLAQEGQEEENSQSTEAGNGQRFSPEQVVQRLSEKLNLTDDQKSQITPIIADRQQQLRALRANTSMRPLQKRRKMKSIFEDSDKKIKSILTAEQRKQYDELEKEMREQMKDWKNQRKNQQ